MGTRLIAGREFTELDTVGSPAVAIVNETFARRVLRPGEWIGQRYRLGRDGLPVEVLGVVEDGKYESLAEAPKAVVFEPILRRYSREAIIIARSSRPEAEVAADMRTALAQLDPRVPVYEVDSLAQLLYLAFLPPRLAVIALGAFGMLAVSLALTGIYGLAAYTVARRTREIAIRVAVGARPTNVVRLVFSRAAVLIMIGSFVGVLLGAIGSQALSGILVGVSTREPLIVSVAVLMMACVALGAVLGPLRRALRVDPAAALRQE
jgi:hypothetical protein